MSEENVEIARRGYAAYNRDGPHAIIEYLDPEVEWGTPEQDPFMTGTYRGHEGVRRFLDEFFELFEEARIEPEEFLDAGDRVDGPRNRVGHVESRGPRPGHLPRARAVAGFPRIVAGELGVAGA